MRTTTAEPVGGINLLIPRPRPARHQPKLQDYLHRSIALHDLSEYLTAYPGTKLVTETKIPVNDLPRVAL